MVDHTHSTDFKKVLQEADAGTYLYQLKCSLPDSFYTDIIHNTNAYRINNFIPDFLYIRQDPVTQMRKIFIIDAKSSKEMSKSHQFQVSSYAFFLSYLIKDIRNLEVDDMGGVWLPSNADAPVTFRIDFILNKIKYIYIDTLVSISQDINPEWVLGKKCNSCQFLKKCKEDAVGTVRSIPYMNEEKATRLKENSMVDIEDLSELLQTLKIESSNEQESKDAQYSTGYENYVNAYSDKKPRFMGYASVLTAKETDHEIYMHLQMDMYSQRPFVYAMKVVDVQKNSTFIEYSFAADYNLHLEDAIISYSKFVDSFIKDLTQILHSMDEISSRCIFYVYNNQEKKMIQDFLYNLVQSEGNELITINAECKRDVISDAMRCLVVLFQDTQLLGLPGIVHFPNMDDLVKTASIGRFCSIEKLLQQNIALGVSGYYSLTDVVEWMGSSNDDNHSGLDNNTIYTQWKKPGQDMTCTTTKLVSQRFTTLQEIMATYWDLANKYMRHTETDLFPLFCKPFRWPIVQTYRHQTLAKLVFFKQLECIKSCDEIRMDRIRDLSTLEQANNVNESSLGGLVLEYRKRFDGQSAFDHRLVFSVNPFLNGPHVQQKLDRLTIDTFKQYILVPNTREV